jgi:hypothetical protein
MHSTAARGPRAMPGLQTAHGSAARVDVLSPIDGRGPRGGGGDARHPICRGRPARDPRTDNGSGSAAHRTRRRRDRSRLRRPYVRPRDQEGAADASPLPPGSPLLPAAPDGLWRPPPAGLWAAGVDRVGDGDVPGEQAARAARRAASAIHRLVIAKVLMSATWRPGWPPGGVSGRPRRLMRPAQRASLHGGDRLRGRLARWRTGTAARNGPVTSAHGGNRADGRSESGQFRHQPRDAPAGDSPPDP